MRRAAATIFISHEDSKANLERPRLGNESITSDHPLLGMHSPSASSSLVPCCPPSRSRSSIDVVDYDDGSVASKLLTSITKSLSSPSLLACCKESARETPYQKTLRLRKMKLQHCAEELGSESSDGSVCDGDYSNICDSLRGMSYLESSSQSTREFSKAQKNTEGNASSMTISVRSSPSLACIPLVSKHTSQIKERSFPPPLTHSLPRLPSSDSFSYSLRAYREDGRFVLKEVKVPCKQYFQASRKEGRLTLQRLTTDEDFESKHSNEAPSDLQEDDNVCVHQATANVEPEKAPKGGSCDKVEVESVNTDNLVGELEVCRGKESKKSDHVGMNKINDRSNVKKVGCLTAKSSPMANFGSTEDDKVTLISHVGASSRIKSDFKTTKPRTSKASRMRLSNQHMLSSSWNQQSPIHLPGKGPNLKLGHDFDVPKLSQCAANSGLESKSTRGVSIGGGKTLQGFEITSASLRKSGYGVGKSASSTIIFKDVSAKCLMENVTKLVASFGLDIGGKWSCGEEIESRELDNNSLCSSEGVMESSMYNGIQRINIGVRESENGHHKSIGGVSFDVKCERSFCCAALKEGVGADVASSCFPIHFDLQIPSSTNNQLAALQGKEWLHTLHCKEIFDRNQLLVAKGFMRLHCVA